MFSFYIDQLANWTGRLRVKPYVTCLPCGLIARHDGTEPSGPGRSYKYSDH